MTPWMNQRTAAILAEHDRDKRLSAGAIARRLGVTRNQVIGALHRSRPGWARHYWNETQGGRTMARTKKLHHLIEPGPLPRVYLGALPVPETCRFMIDNGEGVRDPNWRWCGKPCAPGKPYCLDHCKVCYRRPDEQAGVLAA